MFEKHFHYLGKYPQMDGPKLWLCGKGLVSFSLWMPAIWFIPNSYSITISAFDRVENIVSKRENASYQHFLHFSPSYQTANFRLFQTERVCRRQFQIWQKWQKVIQTGRKHSGKRRNCSLRAISHFPTVFSKGLVPRGVKRCHCVGMG